MEIQIDTSADEISISLVGNLTTHQATSFAERLLLLCVGKFRESIVIDLSQCSTIDSLGYGALVGFRLAPEVHGKVVKLVGVNETIHAQLRTLHMENLFEIHAAPGNTV